MDLIDTLRSTGAVREFTDEPVDDATLARILDTARFAPSGANAQAWRVVVVKDPAIRTSLRDLYLPPWIDYLTLTAAGLRPWSPVNDSAAEVAALAAGTGPATDAATGGMAAHLDEVPVLLALFADLSQLAAVDRDLDRYSLAGGASVYPFAWSILLAARAEGLGGVLTTMLIRAEEEVKRLLGAQDPLVLAAVIALGHPVRQPRRLTRQPVSSFTTVDRVDGAPFTSEHG
ncbi:nitroreductase family protein [Mycobacterium sp. CVI_P3]|uniref:Nitroreductase family protein n=1 Tax=Mycobacterium pinniadriaticum TaxID=2994102 RepID=A0ABT3SII1_9MYCO|nr:nitroreductase family protein [Mycobacterium pinniadriaticum]MCX2932906.1 nitroreductase family protein [Mycobacterium pinniadriaticum]MCX2939329.1 nitroreductase family protein [Mycobacterium pinniadriaticum]